VERSRTRRKFIAGALAAGTLAGGAWPRAAGATSATESYRRTLPGDPGWPSADTWAGLGRAVGGRLIAIESPFRACASGPGDPACAALLRDLKNPYAIGDNLALTQTTGWLDAWSSSPSAYAVAARDAQDVVHAVNFAREHRLRLAIKGGGHSYMGTSNAAGSLLVWTRAMADHVLHDAFVPAGCAGKFAPAPAVSVGTGATWLRTYDAVASAGRYVQGGGCATVGVAGLVLGGGFGSFSKRYGLGGASLLEAEIVTADGAVRVVNACRDPELHWALKGGGNGSFGVVTRLTLRTHELPSFFGGVGFTVRASSDVAYRALIARFVAFYRTALFNPHWGEQVRFSPDNALAVSMVFQDLDRDAAERVWQPFFAWLRERPRDYAFTAPPSVVAVPARQFWNASTLKSIPGVVLSDDRPGANPGNVFWAGNQGEAGWFIHGYESVWMPAALFEPGSQARLADALFAASRPWHVTLHFNKGLAGAPREALAAARDTAMNPVVLEAAALAIAGGGGPPRVPGTGVNAPDVAKARDDAARIAETMQVLRRRTGARGSYVSESSFFLHDWRAEQWGPHYARLLAAKRRYDPDGLFTVHHGVGSEDWSADGNLRLRPA
jgi:FAD/FMN-containing dehydrogenase